MHSATAHRRRQHYIEQVPDVNGPAWRAFCVVTRRETPYDYSFLSGMPRHPGLRVLAELDRVCRYRRRR